MLSVIIPVYRTEATLRRCVDSVLGQQSEDCQLEVILVDDESPDASGGLCDDYSYRHPNVRVLHCPNGGLSAARNRGLAMAEGDIITFVDSDDWLRPDTYAPLLAKMAERPDLDIVEFPVCVHGKRLAFPDQEYSNMAAYWYDGQAYCHSYAWNKLYRRTLFTHERFPEGRVFEDIHTLPRLLQHARCVATVSCGEYVYEDNPLGITAQASAKQHQQLLEAHLSVIRDIDLLHAGNTTDYAPSSAAVARYHQHVLNIQISCVIFGAPILLRRSELHLCAASSGSWRNALKVIAVRLLGLPLACRLTARIHRPT